MENQDIRWRQRFDNYLKALAKLQAGMPEGMAGLSRMSELEKEGLIQRFEYTHELAWNVMKDYLEYQGIQNITGSHDAIREAFQAGLLEDGENWMETIRSRNQTSHTYNEQVANEILEKIVTAYYSLFVNFREKMDTLWRKNP
ncbi:MAG: nucleotidyltransferase substrate binding protein [Saprospiraceae bacterium]|nr:nucleotidyltransferase substrate binding protein [Saprospiraceae bacterium]